MRGTIVELYLYDPKKSKHGFIEGKTETVITLIKLVCSQKI